MKSYSWMPNIQTQRGGKRSTDVPSAKLYSLISSSKRARNVEDVRHSERKRSYPAGDVKDVGSTYKSSLRAVRSPSPTLYVMSSSEESRESNSSSASTNLPQNEQILRPTQIPRHHQCPNINNWKSPHER